MNSSNIFPVALSFLLLTTSACATLPPTGDADATGEPLHVAIDYDVRDEVVKKKVGESVISSTDSDETVTVDSYTTQQLRIAYESWSLKQGNSTLDEVDFYAIAGEGDIAADILRQRAKAKRRANIGIGTAIGGYALALAGMLLTYRGASSQAPGQPRGFGRAVMLYGGGLIGAAGTMGWAYSGREKLLPGYVLMGREKARETAASYNERIQATTPPDPDVPTGIDEIVTIEPGTGRELAPRPRYRVLEQ